MRIFFILYLALFAGWVFAQRSTALWIPDQGDGTYQNPILFADYSDPDLCRVGEDYYLTASSFNCIPGLPILHSRDLVNWELIGYALDRLTPDSAYNRPGHGAGVWAPAIRYHDSTFYIYYGDPDYGLFMVTARDPAGPWTRPHLVQAGRGWIDPCPFWDDDGQAYLVHAWAGSRAGIKSVLVMHRMQADGKALLGEPVLIFDGHAAHPTVEGPKMYKRQGYYYILAPAGGVSTGWQLALRARQPWGPYEARVVMAQGDTPINGPHQGGWVETPAGASWFMHFQDRGPWGRVVHLQPMTWVAGWPVIGHDPEGDGTGVPVLRHRKPVVDWSGPPRSLTVDDEFDQPRLGQQWQWHGNRQATWGYASGYQGYYRLYARPAETANLWDYPNLLLQKLPGPAFTATAKLTFHLGMEGEEAGLLIMGQDYAYLSLRRTATGLQVVQASCRQAPLGRPEQVHARQAGAAQTCYLRVTVDAAAGCRFSYSLDGQVFDPLGEVFPAREGRWIGAKLGFFARRLGTTHDAGYVDIDWIRFTTPQP